MWGGGSSCCPFARADARSHRPHQTRAWIKAALPFASLQSRAQAGLLAHHAPDPKPLSDLPLNDPAASDEAAEGEPKPRRKKRPIGWSMISIVVLVVISATLVWRRDGFSGVTEILFHDLSLFSGILPRVLAGCLLGAFITEISPHDKVSRSLGPRSGLKGLLIDAAFGAILPGGRSRPIPWRARCLPSAPISAPPSPWS